MEPAKTESLGSITKRLVRLRIWLSEHVRISELQATLLWAALIGVAGAWSSIAFREITDLLHKLATGSDGGYVESFTLLPPWRRIAVPAIGGLFAGLTLFLGTRFKSKQNSTDYMEAVVVGNGNLSVRASLVKSISALFSGATGASIGREGPLVQLSSLVASVIGQWFKFPLARRRQMVACGAAAGIASAYNAPIAGAFFVAEIVLGSMAMNAFGPLVIASLASTLTTRAYMGSEALYAAPIFTLHGNRDFLAYLALGIACGFIAPAFLNFLKVSERGFSKLKLPAYIRLAIGGAIVGLLAIYRPEVCGNGRSLVFAILNHPGTWQALAIVLACKLLATGATFGSGAVGGVFTPTLFTGAACGYLFGALCTFLLPGWGMQPGAFGLVGMGAFLAAATGAPVMAIIMIFELTLNYEILMPVMLAAVVSYYICRSITSRSLYGDALARKGQHAVTERLGTLKVVDLMQPRGDSLKLDSSFGLVARSFLQNRHDFLPVVDGDHFSGIVLLHDIKPYLDQPELESLLIARDVMREGTSSLNAKQTLEEALHIFARSDTERLPVLDDQAHLLGSLTKSDVLLFLAGIPKSTEA
ncbi:ClcB-like voltage-gated chloride channel protein [Luteolibacter pohnpeiensis]|uniref:ClcB-like voltage-gated chloride channel protein n=1 Tax=Luteolibacter pohnpeiensis TaxID=454153 RepID=A0A934VWE0_9BACT|nr:ClcB-like voltage-gated chloride channel protein [Luteolibacter pohnpeiensis]MBK1884512.1 ClcB-like voltage-gated chloride channel protein [Luteolibacter pohnpeiensis]